MLLHLLLILLLNPLLVLLLALLLHPLILAARASIDRLMIGWGERIEQFFLFIDYTYVFNCFVIGLLKEVGGWKALLEGVFIATDSIC